MGTGRNYKYKEQGASPGDLFKSYLHTVITVNAGINNYSEWASDT